MRDDVVLSPYLIKTSTHHSGLDVYGVGCHWQLVCQCEVLKPIESCQTAIENKRAVKG